MDNKRNTQEHYSSGEDVLVKLGEKSSDINKAKDINSKLSSLEDNLGALQSKLRENDQRVMRELQGINDNNTNLTEKISEAYIQLGGIDKEYKALSHISSSIEQEVNRLSVEIKDVSEQSTSDVLNLNENHDEMVRRVNELVVSSQQTNKKLSQSITENTAALKKYSEQLVSEINDLADTTQTRDEQIEQELNASKKDIQENKAKILKMQAVDEALAKRTSQLEDSTGVLKNNLQNLYFSFSELDNRTRELGTLVKKLSDQGEDHAGLINNIQEDTAVMGLSLHKLGIREKKHFTWLSISVVAVFVISLMLYGYQMNTQINDTQTLAAGQQQIQQNLTSSQASAQATTDALTLRNTQLENEVASMKQQLVNVDEHISSIDSRIDYIAPYSTFGKDSIIHGPQWLAAQSADNFSIQLASAKNKKQLHEIALRYSHYLTTDVSYYKSATAQGEQYVLVVGSFSTYEQAASALWRMPSNINFQRPTISRVADIQKLI